MSFRTRLTLFLVLIVVVPMVAVGVVVFRLISDNQTAKVHELVQRHAITDELTGLSNHRRFQEVMAQEVGRAKRFGQDLGLVMLDIDHFKTVNDTYGHQQGDVVLREVARVLRDSYREIDEPARYGGEELAVALPQTDLDGAYLFAERVRIALEALRIPRLGGGGGHLRVTACSGPRRCPGQGTTRGR
jgi:diguanylate cyclase (GGDEF)-like protein